MTVPLSGLLDCRALRAELGISRAAAEAIMRRLPIVSIEGLRKTYVRREDVQRYLDACTFAKDEVPGRDSRSSEVFASESRTVGVVSVWSRAAGSPANPHPVSNGASRPRNGAYLRDES